jgi:putative oxygen-independent coproporphyrinogen III oxidase
MPDLMPPPLALYIHIPWCVKKCPYCDFNSHGQKSDLPVAEYIAALTRDLEQDLPLVWGRTISSVFFGGGTPSLFSGAAIGEILAMSSSRLRFAPNCEITMECNPGTVEHDRFENYLSAGVNRLSFGVQSFDDGCLERLGRIHNAEKAREAVLKAQNAGFNNINLDLMYALPEQTLAMALYDVEQAIALNPQHLSHYQLTLEPNTLFAAKPPAGIPEMDDAWDMQERCIELMSAHGYAQYEVSAYAKPGKRCQHNLNYWQYGDYLGIGAGAHGKISSGESGQILRRWKPKHPETYISTAGADSGVGGDEVVTEQNRPFDYMLNALRLVDGFSLKDFEYRTGLSRNSIAPELQKAFAEQWLSQEGDWVKPTELGMRFANDVMGLFLSEKK